jgi:hypothetical protein
VTNFTGIINPTATLDHRMRRPSVTGPVETVKRLSRGWSSILGGVEDARRTRAPAAAMVAADRGAGDFSGGSNRRGTSRGLFEAAAHVKKPVPCIALLSARVPPSSPVCPNRRKNRRPVAAGSTKSNTTAFASSRVGLGRILSDRRRNGFSALR